MTRFPIEPLLSELQGDMNNTIALHCSAEAPQRDIHRCSLSSSSGPEMCSAYSFMKLYLWKSAIVLQLSGRTYTNSQQPSALTAGYSVAYSLHATSFMGGHVGRVSNVRTIEGGLLASAQPPRRHFKSYPLCFVAVVCSSPYLKTTVQ